MNIREFAKLCGCTHTTVSCAFAHPEKLRPSTLERILALASEHNFRPNRAAAAALNGSTRSIGVLSYAFNSYFEQVNLGIQERLLAARYLPVVLMAWGDDRLELLRRLVDQRVDGVILVDPKRKLNEPEQREFDTIDIPHVYIEPPPGIAADQINTDDAAGGRLAAEHLLQLGHRRFGIVRRCVPGGRRILPDRTEAFAGRVTAAGGEVSTAVESELPALLGGCGRPTAVFLESDALAPMFYDTARSLGLAIPEDVSVVGFADLLEARLARPALTTVRQDGGEVGRRAAERMLLRLGNRAGAPVAEIVPVSLVVRGSTAPPQYTTKKGVLHK